MNIIYSFLNQLGVRRLSERYCLQMLLSSPRTDTLLGIKKLLSRMGVPTSGVQYDDPLNDTPQFPSIVHLGNAFEVATSRTWPKQKDLWDGIALLPLSFDPSQVAEPDYLKHRLMRLFEWLCVATVFVLIPVTVLSARDYFLSGFMPSAVWSNLSDPVIVALLALHLLGLAVGFLLLQKSIMGHSRVGDRICDAFSKRHSCGDVLDSPAAKILGFSWSEIGFGYFLAQLTALLFVPDQCFIIISFLAMLFAFWSIAYQWRHHAWCALCLLTQAILWAEGILILLSMGFSQFFYFESPLQAVGAFVSACCFVAFVILVTHFVAGYLSERRRREENEWYTRGLLRRKDVFLALLDSRPPCPYTEADITEREGNPDCPLEEAVVVFTRPNSCVHCRSHQKKEEAFVATLGDRIALCRINLDPLSPEQREAVYSRLGLNATPRVLYRHHILPDQYSLDDLQELL